MFFDDIPSAAKVKQWLKELTPEQRRAYEVTKKQTDIDIKRIETEEQNRVNNIPVISFSQWQQQKRAAIEKDFKEKLRR